MEQSIFFKSSWNQQSWKHCSSWQKNSSDFKSKGKCKKGQDKGKGKGDQGKARKVANVESDVCAQEQQPAAAAGDQLEPEVTVLFSLEGDMPPKTEEPQHSESLLGHPVRVL